MFSKVKTEVPDCLKKGDTLKWWINRNRCLCFLLNDSRLMVLIQCTSIGFRNGKRNRTPTLADLFTISETQRDGVLWKLSKGKTRMLLSIPIHEMKYLHLNSTRNVMCEGYAITAPMHHRRTSREVSTLASHLIIHQLPDSFCTPISRGSLIRSDFFIRDDTTIKGEEKAFLLHTISSFLF